MAPWQLSPIGVFPDRHRQTWYSQGCDDSYCREGNVMRSKSLPIRATQPSSEHAPGAGRVVGFGLRGSCASRRLATRP